MNHSTQLNTIWLNPNQLNSSQLNSIQLISIQLNSNPPIWQIVAGLQTNFIANRPMW